MRILFVDELGIDTYSRATHMSKLRKFLGWGGDLLIVGGYGYHEKLYEAYHKFSGEDPGKPIIAGDLSPVPEFDCLFVTKWCSFHFDIDTPREMESIVLEVLGARRLGDYS